MTMTESTKRALFIGPWELVQSGQGAERHTVYHCAPFGPLTRGQREGWLSVAHRAGAWEWKVHERVGGGGKIHRLGTEPSWRAARAAAFAAVLTITHDGATALAELPWPALVPFEDTDPTVPHVLIRANIGVPYRPYNVTSSTAAARLATERGGTISDYAVHVQCHCGSLHYGRDHKAATLAYGEHYTREANG